MRGRNGEVDPKCSMAMLKEFPLVLFGFALQCLCFSMVHPLIFLLAKIFVHICNCTIYKGYAGVKIFVGYDRKHMNRG